MRCPRHELLPRQLKVQPQLAPVSGGADTKVTLSLTNVPLIEALRYLTELAGLKYKIEPYAVSIVPDHREYDGFADQEVSRSTRIYPDLGSPGHRYHPGTRNNAQRGH